MNILQKKLANGTDNERNAVVAIIWVLAANNQKAKKILKSIHLDKALDELIKQCKLLKYEASHIDEVGSDRINIVLNLLRNSN